MTVEGHMLEPRQEALKRAKKLDNKFPGISQLFVKRFKDLAK